IPASARLVADATNRRLLVIASPPPFLGSRGKDNAIAGGAGWRAPGTGSEQHPGARTRVAVRTRRSAARLHEHRLHVAPAPAPLLHDVPLGTQRLQPIAVDLARLVLDAVGKILVVEARQRNQPVDVECRTI